MMQPSNNELLLRLETELCKYIQDCLKGVLFYQLVRYDISENFQMASMDRCHSFHYSNNPNVALEMFARAMNQARLFYDSNVSLVSKLYVENHEKRNIIAKYVHGDNCFRFFEDSERHSLVYEFMTQDCSQTSHLDGQNSEPNYERKTLNELFEEISELPLSDVVPILQFDSLSKINVPENDPFGKMLYYGLAQNKPLFEYCFINPSHQMHGNIIGDGVLVLFCSEEIPEVQYSGIESRFTRWAATLSIRSLQFLMQKANIKSAIGSIMSRNGSHNIGSHVLSALSHNVGTMPDDRMLYQYIQHRMDYIASATTGAPDWSVPTPFVGNLMKMFYSQRHLLEHIAESDGLHAYQYQGKGTQIGDGQTNCVKIVTRRISRHEGEIVGGESEVKEKDVFGQTVYMYEFFQKTPSVSEKSDNDCKTEKDGDTSQTETTDETAQSVKWEYDEVVSVPGGILGQHAFYNIVENVLRNAAKHSWAGKSKEERKRAKNLEIYVDFEKDRPDGTIWFTVGDNMSKLFQADFWTEFFAFAEKNGNPNIQSAFANPLDGFEVPPDDKNSNRIKLEDFLKGRTSSESLPSQYKVLYDYILRHWDDLIKIDSFKTALQGVPDKKENGDPDNSKPGHRLPLPLHHRQEKALAEPFINLETNRLRQSAWGLSEMKISAGYLRRTEVSVIGGLEQPKPGEHPLIVPIGVPRSAKEKATWEDLCLAYRFWVKLPKDVLIVTDNPTQWERFKQWEGIGVTSYDSVFGEYDKDDKTRGKKGNIGLMSDYGFVLVDHIRENDKWEIDDKLKLPFRALEIAGGSQKGTLGLPCVPETALKEAGTRKKFVECVYLAWLDDLKHRRLSETAIPADLKIRLKIYEETGSENGLITDKDIYEVLFCECLHSVLEPIANSSRLKKYQREALLLVSLYPLDKKDPLFDCMPESFDGHDDMLKEMLGEIAGNVLRFLDSPLSNDYAKLRGSYQIGLERVKGSGWLKIQPVLDFISRGTGSEAIAEVKNELQNMADNDNSPLNSTAAEALDIARTTSDVFLRKYEEQIVTLPAQYKSSTRERKETNDEVEETPDERRKLPDFSAFGLSLVDGEYKGNVDIAYKRHDNIEPGALYCEALSGSQTYLNALANLSETDEQWAMRLAENGLLRILIIDERVCAFLKDHGDAIKNAYVAMHISVADTEQKPDFNPVETTFPDLMQVPLVKDDDDAKDTDFDLVVIHQGIIDKWWPNAHSSADVSKILQSLRDSNRSGRSRFVVVTTGRGRPDNIPDNEKVLAFSSIESFLFKRYPEKLNLVDTIMNILPGSPERNNEDA